MKHRLTPVITKSGRWYVAYMRGISGVNTQGRTMAEARQNLKEALALVMEANKELSRGRNRTKCYRGLQTKDPSLRSE